MKKRIGFCLMTLLCLLSGTFSGCSASGKETARSVLGTLCAGDSAAPAGTVFVYPAFEEDGTDEVMDEAMLLSLFGGESLPPELEEAVGIACYLSHRTPYEILIFKCKNASGSEKIAQMCLRRLEQIKSYWKDFSDEYPYLNTAGVTSDGNWVMLSVCPDIEECRRIFRRTV